MLLGPGDETIQFFWNRVAARLDWVALALAALAAAMGFALPRAVPWPLVFALGFLPYAAAPPTSIDASLYAELALAMHHDGVLATLAAWPEQAWQGAAGHLHRALPGLPLSVAAGLAAGVPHRVVLGAWALALAGGAALLHPRAAPLLLAAPLVWALSGELLVDLPLTAAVAFGLAGARRGRWSWALPAFLLKLSAGVFLLGPLACLALRPWEGRRRAALTLAAGALAVAAVALAVDHHVRPPMSYASALRSVALQLGPWVVLAALAGLLRAPSRERWLALSSLAGLLLVLRFAPTAHAARYALPLAPALAWMGALAFGDRGANAIAGFGLALGLVAWRPLVLHHQGANLAEAIAALPEGVEVIELYGAYRGQAVPPDFLAPVLALETGATVRFVGRLEDPAPPVGPRRHAWWQRRAPAPAGPDGGAPADARLVVALGGEPPGPPPGWTLAGRFDRRQGSSFAFPDRVLLYLPARATP